MSPGIKERCSELKELINEYSDCLSCGQVIRDKTLLVPDEDNPKRFKSICPKCGRETSKIGFPPDEIKQLFNMITEASIIEKPILVLILTRTIFEVMVDGLLIRLMERRFTSADLSDAVMERTKYHTKLNIIQDITGKNLKGLAKKAGYPKLTSRLEM